MLDSSSAGEPRPLLTFGPKRPHPPYRTVSRLPSVDMAIRAWPRPLHPFFILHVFVLEHCMRSYPSRNVSEDAAWLNLWSHHSWALDRLVVAGCVPRRVTCQVGIHGKGSRAFLYDTFYSPLEDATRIPVPSTSSALQKIASCKR